MVWLKIIHILCVMGWMTSVFAVPRALIFWKREYAETQKFGPLMTGGMVIRAKRGEFRESDLYLRIFNEISVVGVIAILWLVVAKPF